MACSRIVTRRSVNERLAPMSHPPLTFSPCPPFFFFFFSFLRHLLVTGATLACFSIGKPTLPFEVWTKGENPNKAKKALGIVRHRQRMKEGQEREPPMIANVIALLAVFTANSETQSVSHSRVHNKSRSQSTLDHAFIPMRQ